MNNIISTSSHILSDYPIHEAIHVLRKEGYSGIELWFEDFKHQEKKGVSSYAKIKKAIIQTGLKGVIHAPLRDSSGKKLNICSKDETLRKRSIKLNLESVNLARQFGFHLVNIHPGRMDNDKDTPGDYWPLLFDAFRQLLPAAEEGSIILAVEAMELRPKEFVVHASDIIRLLSHFNSGYLGATLDIVHSYTHGEDFPLRHFEDLKKLHLRHFHVSGYYGVDGKTHCPFRIDSKNLPYFSKILKKVVLDYDGIITVEGAIKGIFSETQENQLKVVRDNIDFIRSSVGGV